jgi:predicted ABC-type transport system involved in lysophospholipase L1 biosynthesis ATPase subunit
MSEEAIRASGLKRSVPLNSGDVLPILADVNLLARAGDCVGIVGSSGSGKSTLLALLGLLDRPDGGSVSIAGLTTEHMSDARRSQLRNQHVGFVFQNYLLLPHLTAAQNVALPFLQGRRVPRREMKRRTAECLRAVGLAGRAHAYPRHLSGGEQQRVAIARALVRRPRIVLADEPTGSLDRVTAETVLGLLLAEIRDSGTTLILVTHDAQIAARTDRTLLLADGRLYDANLGTPAAAAELPCG